MIVTDPAHKAFLYSLFLETRSDGRKVQKNFPIDQLADASTAAKKLRQGSVDEDGMVRFKEGKQTFTAEEWMVLKDLVKTKKTGTVDEYQVYQEVNNLFKKDA